MTVFVSITPKTGDIARYNARKNGTLLRTHAATLGRPVSFNQATCDQFRSNPPERFRIAKENWVSDGPGKGAA